MPDPLSPLFATMGLGTIVTYAYQGVRFSAREWWWMLTKMFLSFPRMLYTGIKLWRDNPLSRYIEALQQWLNCSP